MKISSKKLIGLKVETLAGEKIGQVKEFNIQIDSQSIVEYLIKPASLLKSFVVGELIVNRGQVVDISAEKMIVDNNVIAPEMKKKIKSPAKEKMVAGMLTKDK